MAHGSTVREGPPRDIPGGQLKKCIVEMREIGHISGLTISGFNATMVLVFLHF